MERRRRQFKDSSAESILSAVSRNGPVADCLLSRLARKDCGGLRASCRDGNALVRSHLSEVELHYQDGWSLTGLNPRDYAEREGERDPAFEKLLADVAARVAAAEAAQTLRWPGLLASFPRCHSLAIHTGIFWDHYLGMEFSELTQEKASELCELLLGPFAARPEITTQVSQLRLQRGVSLCKAAPPTSLPSLISQAFCSLADLRLTGEWAAPDRSLAPVQRRTAGFFAALSTHLPGLQRLQLSWHQGLEDIDLLADSMTQLRELTLGSYQEELLQPRREPVSAAAAVALGRLTQLRRLSLLGVSPPDDGLVNVLRLGLPNSLQEFEASRSRSTWRNPYLRLISAEPETLAAASSCRLGRAGDAAAGGSGGSMAGGGSAAGVASAGGGGQEAVPRRWNVFVGIGTSLDVEAAAEAVADAGLAVERLEIGVSCLEVSRSPLLPRCRQVVVGRLQVENERDAAQLAQAVRALGAPERLMVSDVRRRFTMPPLLAAAPLLAPRLRRLAFLHCAGLTPGALIRVLCALPLCEEVEIAYCARLCTVPQWRELVRALLALPQGQPLRRSRLRIDLSSRLYRDERPLADDESADETSLDGGETGFKIDTSAEGQVAEVVSRVVRRVRGAAVEAELNGELERAGVAARVKLSLE